MDKKNMQLGDCRYWVLGDHNMNELKAVDTTKKDKWSDRLTPQNQILEFKKFQYLNLDFNDKVFDYIHKTTNSNNPSERLSEKVHVLQRNSKENIYEWRKRLTKDEIEKINIGTKNVFQKLSNFLLSNQVLN